MNKLLVAAWLLTALLVAPAGYAQPLMGHAQLRNLSPPEQDFEAFWTTFRDHYAFFPQKRVDWNSTYRTYRRQVTAQTTEAALISVFKAMVEPLHDGHITLARGDMVLYKGESARNTFKQTFRPVRHEFWRVAYRQLQTAGFAPVQASGPIFKGTHLLYATRTKEVGYLHLTRCFAEITGVIGTAAQEKQDQYLLQSLVAQALVPLADCRTLLVDVRDNGGGHSGYELAGRFSRRRVLANYKATRLPGSYDHFTAPQPYYLIPAPGPHYTCPVVLLTSDQTASAAEDFTLALSQRANVIRVGTATKGMMSDMYNATLPSGLQLTLSNQRYTSRDGRVLEDVGVQPSLRVENTLTALQRQQDPVIAQALEVAAQQKRVNDTGTNKNGNKELWKAKARSSGIPHIQF